MPRLATLTMLLATWMAAPVPAAPAPQTPSPWTEALRGAITAHFEGTLLHPAGAGADLFGIRVAVDGDTAVVSAVADRTVGIGSHGSVQVFVRTAGVWTHEAELLHPTPASGQQFGSAVAVEGDTIVVGAVGGSSAQVYVRSGTTWTHEAELRQPCCFFPLAPGFGSAVALHGNAVLVGAPLDNVTGPDPGTGAITNDGSVQVYLRSATGWSHLAELTDPAVAGNPALARGDQFGSSLALDADTAVIGAPRDDTAGTDAGAAHVFTSDSWSHLSMLVAPDGGAFDGFGSSVAASGTLVIVGAPFDDTTAGVDAGSAHVFDDGTYEARLVHPASSAGDEFGNSVGIAGDLAVVGAPADDVAGTFGGPDGGTVQVFGRDGGTWSPEVELNHPEDVAGLAGDRFGHAVAIDGATVVVGAPFDNHAAGADAGAAFVNGLLLPATPTSTALLSSLNPSSAGTPVTYTATVDPVEAPGDVRFVEEGAVIGGCDAQPLAAGTATCTTVHETPGNRVIVASYLGSDDFAASSSAPLLQVVLGNEPPDCAAALASPPTLGAPDHRLKPVAITGVTDPEGGPISIRVTGVRQDEPVMAAASGRTCPDATGVGTATPQVRAERLPLRSGRVYHVAFTATDPQGEACSGVAKVCVPHVPWSACVDQGPLFDSTGCP